MSILQLLLTLIHPQYARISPLHECITCLFNNSFHETWGLELENFVHNVWFFLIAISNLKTFRKQRCQTQNYF